MAYEIVIREENKTEIASKCEVFREMNAYFFRFIDNDKERKPLSFARRKIHIPLQIYSSRKYRTEMEGEKVDR
jgi:hypothetical protein